MAPLPGYHGRILDVDLTRGRLTEQPLPDAWALQHLGGRGLAARILWERLGREGKRPDPLGPDNVLVFATGPLVGIALPGSGRHCVAARSPLSGLWGEAYAGGFWGTELRLAGWDAIALHGRSGEPVVLSVTDPSKGRRGAPGHAELHPAADLWGRAVSEAEEALLARWRKARVSSIGLAGELGVRFAAVMNDRNRAAGRTGLGAVMGSKGLKAIVVRGLSGNAPALHDEDAFRAARKAYVGTLMDEATRSFGVYGTPGSVGSLDHEGLLPTRYWEQGSWPGEADEVTGERQNDTILVGRDNCTACHVRCKRVVEATYEGERVDRKHGGPEYETIAAFASLQQVPSLDYVAAANKWCNEHGMDTISAGSAVAFAMAAKEQGHLGALDHHEQAAAPSFGQGPEALALLHRIARREGALGDLLAEGTMRAAERLGCTPLAAHVKGVELPMHEPRGKKGVGLSYAVSPRGANHMEGAHDTELERDRRAPELGVHKGLTRYDASPDKARVVKVFEDARSFVNSLVVCAFTVNDTGRNYNLGHVRAMVEAATGFAMGNGGAQGPRAMLEVGERNLTLARMLGVAWGLRPEQDTLPKAIQAHALPYGKGGSARRETLGGADLERMKAAYYEARGWGADGAPTPATRQRLGLA